MSSSSHPRRTTAAALVIGDEILKGQVRDVNSHLLAVGLKDLGIDLRRVCIVPDDLEEISNEVLRCSTSFDFVVTSGGIGPTHDDLTLEAVAKAFGDELRPHPTLVGAIERLQIRHENRLRLAEVPSSAELHFPPLEEPIGYPLISVRNVFVFPGVPVLFRKVFRRIFVPLASARFSKPPSFSGEAFVTRTELEIVDRLDDLVARYKGRATFGSYPEWGNDRYKTRIAFESDCAGVVEEIAVEIRKAMPTANRDGSGRDELERFLETCDDCGMVEAVRKSLDVTERCFREFGVEGVVMAVNGGKDCIAMVHLVHACAGAKRLRALYVQEDEPFEEVERFIDLLEAAYDLSISRVRGPIKEALRSVVRSNPVKACLLGMRMGDPGSSGLGSFAPTDGDWPPMTRVNPILHWDYHQVWKFIRGLNLPYPSLYDRGYTSLGNRKNTKPNPHLKVSDAEAGRTSYRPAYELENPEWERDGRK